ncbi:aldo/keto reductase [Flintibacter muris]|uniref:aldo/keto reductase n=1 Tax=Flintibacter muris TaxID=2941327 RepID=UPI002041BD43|nr:aldo/keto reductase [Flintibacter muris]
MACLLTMTSCSAAEVPAAGSRTNPGSAKLTSESQPMTAFADVPADAWYAEAVAYCQQNGIMSGTTDTTFAPEATLTRAMLVTILWRQAEKPVVNYLMQFSDVPEGQWHSEAVRWAASEKLMAGYGDGRFGINDPITQEQLNLIFQRYTGQPVTGDIPGFDGSSKPVTRAQAAMAVMNFAQLSTEKKEIGMFNFEAKTVMLNSGYVMPLNGLGTYSLHGEICINSVKSALASGVRLIDTASAYGNEEEVGQAIREAMEEFGIQREEIFVTTKIYPGSEMANPERSIQACLDRLDIGYVDLMLLHHPDRNDVKAYQAMEKFVEEGKIRSIGLSNWYVKELEEFLPQVTITPALVQNEIHPYYQENDVIPYIQDLGIVVQGWYPLGGRGHTAELLGDEVISGIAKAHGVSSAQVILRWNLQKGVVVIPGSSNPDHIEENTEIYDFALTNAEMDQINALDRGEKHDWY